MLVYVKGFCMRILIGAVLLYAVYGMKKDTVPQNRNPYTDVTLKHISRSPDSESGLSIADRDSARSTTSSNASSHIPYNHTSTGQQSTPKSPCRITHVPFGSKLNASVPHSHSCTPVSQGSSGGDTRSSANNNGPSCLTTPEDNGIPFTPRPNEPFTLDHLPADTFGNMPTLTCIAHILLAKRQEINELQALEESARQEIQRLTDQHMASIQHYTECRQLVESLVTSAISDKAYISPGTSLSSYPATDRNISPERSLTPSICLLIGAFSIINGQRQLTPFNSAYTWLLELLQKKGTTSIPDQCYVYMHTNNTISVTKYNNSKIVNAFSVTQPASMYRSQPECCFLLEITLTSERRQKLELEIRQIA